MNVPRECEMCFSVTEPGSTTFSAFTETINIYFYQEISLSDAPALYTAHSLSSIIRVYDNPVVVNNDMRVQEKMGTKHTLF